MQEGIMIATEKEVAHSVLKALVGSYTSIETRGPYTTLYWDNNVKDNVPQQQITIDVEGKKFEVLIREKK